MNDKRNALNDMLTEAIQKMVGRYTEGFDASTPDAEGVGFGFLGQTGGRLNRSNFDIDPIVETVEVNRTFEVSGLSQSLGQMVLGYLANNPTVNDGLKQVVLSRIKHRLDLGVDERLVRMDELSDQAKEQNISPRDEKNPLNEEWEKLWDEVVNAYAAQVTGEILAWVANILLDGNYLTDEKQRVFEQAKKGMEAASKRSYEHLAERAERGEVDTDQLLSIGQAMKARLGDIDKDEQAQGFGSYI